MYQLVEGWIYPIGCLVMIVLGAGFTGWYAGRGGPSWRLWILGPGLILGGLTCLIAGAAAFAS